jgi:hypothetical protein
MWRQHRASTAVFGVVFAVFAIAVWITGVHMAHVYDGAAHSCAANGTCDFLPGLFSGYGAIVDTVHLTIVLPVVFAVLGATLVARETEQVTHVLAWTQTITRQRWLYTKVFGALAAALVASAAVSAIVTWWSRTPNSLYGNRFEGAQFDTQSIVPVAFALFAVALGLLVGALWRRALPALATSVGLFIAVRLVVAIYARPNYAATVSKAVPLGADASLPSGSWSVTDHIVDPAGHAVSDGRISIPHQCLSAGRDNATICLGHLGYRDVVKFHPASQYWHFQWTESLLFVAAAVLCTAVALLTMLRRDA